MSDKDTSTMTDGKNAPAPEAAKARTATGRDKPAQRTRRGPGRARKQVSMICIPAQAGNDGGSVAASPVGGDVIAKVVITRDPRKPIYICWEDNEGANLSVAIEAEE